ncbi:hypothetical protein WMY93_031874 [Mugilogobius chulae]|uniref:Methyltransferase-like protein 22 n=1 Tax=Mugilogobius chulae TaxID=88201 RepID=A0AAW0MGM1_9GOBI
MLLCWLVLEQKQTRLDQTRPTPHTGGGGTMDPGSHRSSPAVVVEKTRASSSTDQPLLTAVDPGVVSAPGPAPPSLLSLFGVRLCAFSAGALTLFTGHPSHQTQAADGMYSVTFHHDTVLSDVHMLLPRTRALMTRLSSTGQPVFLSKFRILSQELLQDQTEKGDSPVRVCPEERDSPVRVCPGKRDSPVGVSPEEGDSPVRVCPEERDSPVRVCPGKRDSPVRVCPGKRDSPVGESTEEGDKEQVSTRDPEEDSPVREAPEEEGDSVRASPGSSEEQVSRPDPEEDQSLQLDEDGDFQLIRRRPRRSSPDCGRDEVCPVLLSQTGSLDLDLDLDLDDPAEEDTDVIRIGAEVMVRKLDWLQQELCTDPEEEFSWSEDEVADLYDHTTVIIAADVVYDDDLTDAFFRTMYQLCSSFNHSCDIYISVERRLNFTLRHMEVCCEAYQHFHHCLLQLQDLQGPPSFSAQRMDLSFPQSLVYERVEQLELWKVSASP